MSEQPKRNAVYLPRLGNVQALVEIRGEGLAQQPYVRFTKLLTKGTPAEYQNIWSVEEIAALKQLCEYVLRDIYNEQTRMIPDGAKIPSPETQTAIERP